MDYSSNDFKANELSIRERLLNLIKLPNEIWLHYGLLFSANYDNLKDDDIKYIIFNVALEAQKLNEELTLSYGSIIDILNSYNLKIFDIADSNISFDRELLGYFQGPNKIYIANSEIKRIIKYINKLKLDSLNLFNEDEIKNAILAHEFFHYYEALNKKEIFTYKYKVEAFHLFKLKYKVRLRAISEIFAMEFARISTRLKYNPYILNYLLLCDGRMDEANKMYDTVMELALKEGV